MPTYQYACTACEHRFDQVQSFHDDALIECPECGGKLRKLYGAVGVVFKGSGFYRTDSRSRPSGKDGKDGKAGKDGKDGEKPAAKAEPTGGKETKPATAAKDSSTGSSSSSKSSPSDSGSKTSGSAA